MASFCLLKTYSIKLTSGPLFKANRRLDWVEIKNAIAKAMERKAMLENYMMCNEYIIYAHLQKWKTNKLYRRGRPFQHYSFGRHQFQLTCGGYQINEMIIKLCFMWKAPLVMPEPQCFLVIIYNVMSER